MDDRQLTIDNALRPVSWRFELADSHVRTGRFLSRHKHDYYSCVLAQYLRVCRQPGSRDLSKVPDGADIAAAHHLFVGHRLELRAAVEAMILSDQSPSSIAEKTGLSKKCIEWYERAFFDVKNRLTASVFIIHGVIEEARVRSDSDWKEYGWKLIAYLAGAEVLEQAMGLNEIASLEGFLTTLRLESRVILEQKLACSMEKLDVDNPATAARMLQATHSGGNKAVREDDAPTPILKNIQAMLEGLPFAIGPSDDEAPGIREWDATGVELKNDELMWLAVGRRLPYHDDLWNAKYPDDPQCTGEIEDPKS